jgi:hypothetical protein
MVLTFISDSLSTKIDESTIKLHAAALQVYRGYPHISLAQLLKE